MGEDLISAFIEQLGPTVYNGLVSRGVLNIDTAYDNIMRQLAYESFYGTSPVARKNKNYGGYGYNGKTYTQFKNDEDFVNSYLNLMTSRYKKAVNSANVNDFAKNLKDKGYYEAPYETYSQGLIGMKTLSRTAAKHRKDHPELYSGKILAPMTQINERTGTKKMIFPKGFWDDPVKDPVVQAEPEQLSLMSKIAKTMNAPTKKPEVILPDTVVEGRKKSPLAFGVQLPSILDMFNLLSPLNMMTQYFANILGLPKLNPITPLP